MVMLVLAAAEGEGEGLHLRPASGALGAHVLAVLVEGDGRLTVHRRRLRAHQLGSRRDGEVAAWVAEEGDGEAVVAGASQRAVLHALVSAVAQDLSHPRSSFMRSASTKKLHYVPDYYSTS